MVFLMHRFIITISLLFSCSLQIGLGQERPTSAKASDDRPNFLVFIADDVSWNDFGCYGNGAARTPHIDRLAKNGLKFNNAFLTASSCSPSRASIMTGRYPHNNGDASELHRPWAAHLPTFPGLLRANGYYTTQAGKFHMDQNKQADGTKKLTDAFDRAEKRTNLPGNSGGHGNWVKVTRERPMDKPFFFWFAAIDAHRGWDGDREWNEDMYGPMHRPEDVIVPPFMVDTPKTRADLVSYYNEVTRFDHFIGLVIDELEEQNALENTMIIVMADNGRPFPRAKTRLHDSGMKTPFIVHWPAGIKNGGADRNALVSVIDIAPTFLELADVPAAETMQGVSILPVIKSDASVRKYAFSEHNWHDYEAHGRSVRDSEGWIYIRNARPQRGWIGPADSVSSPSHQDLQKGQAAGTLTKAQADVLLEPRPAEEMYRSPTDPLQINNLVTDTEAATRLEKLRKIMDQWQKETGDSVPVNFSRDYFDRVTGYTDSATGKQITQIREHVSGDAPGFDRGADQINAPGPR